MNAQTLGAIRHLLTLIGGILVSLGLFTDDTFSQLSEAIMAVIGGVMTIIAMISSWKAPEKKLAKKNF